MTMFANRKAMPVASLLVVLLCVGAGVFLASCDRLFKSNGPTPAVALIPGAEFVGQDKCEVCHVKQAGEFRGATHASFTVFMKDPDDKRNIGEGCESCHGPGSLHIESRGDKSKIIRTDWRTCTACHLEKRTALMKRYHHPIEEGRMTCSDCHDPHKGMKPVWRAEEINKTCYECHPDLRGPWVFQHDAVTQEGCVKCHDPHGTDIRMMLVADVAQVCLQCHFDRKQHPGIGDFAHPNASGRFLKQGCTACHPGIHGSNFSHYLFSQ
jgi:predicted CXXCH cytochrome family protein